MGADCCAESRQDMSPTVVPAGVAMKDLPAVDWSGISDTYERFEASLPFNRTLCSVMFAKIDEATQECGDAGFLTL